MDIFKHRLLFLLVNVITFALLLTACVPGVKPFALPETGETAACADFLRDLDKAVAETGVNNAAAFRLDGFPYLRTDRFLCGLKDRVSGQAEKALWVDWMRAEDTMARHTEIACLPSEDRERLADRAGVASSVEALADYAEACAGSLLAAHRDRPGFYAAVSAAVECQSEYKTILRVAGLYPLSALPVAFLTQKAHRRMTRWLDRKTVDIPPRGKWVSYGPDQRYGFSTDEVKRMIAKAAGNALSVPRPDENTRQVLAAAFAPILTQDVRDDADRIGAVEWRDGHIVVDGETPTVYYYFTNAFYNKRPALQINYALWYPARTGPGAPWIERGSLDGLTVRLSLDLEGRPVMVDIMNNCGCYHFFVPVEGSVKSVRSQPLTIDAFAPARLPATFSGTPLNVHVIADWHQVTGLSTQPLPNSDIRYRLVPYQALEMLPKTDGSQESLFNEHGIARGSERIEPFILFSMGIPKVGSMRQRSHHALKLVGKAYFSDPDLFDESFEFVE